MKNGPPHSAVTTPTGISRAAEGAARHRVGEHQEVPPTSTEAGSRRR